MSETLYTIPREEWKGFRGYRANATNADPFYLCPPSVNVMVNERGEVETRLGIEDTGWNLDQANKAATSFYHRTYDITFFAAGTKILYVDHNNANAVVDTGLTLTDGTTTRFSEYAGDVYSTNQTDGLRRIIVGRLNGAVSNGASSMTVDKDMAARLSVFSITSGNLRIGGTNEAFSAVTVATGALTHSTTTSQAYADNAICIVTSDISSGREKFSKIDFWKERMTGIGSLDATNADQPNANVFFSKFATAAVLENIIDFSYGSGGAARELVGKSGANTNILATEDYLYVFKEKASYVISTSDVNASTGASIPNLRSPVHGCINEDSACDMGNGEISLITNDKRIMRIKIATDSGAAVVFPDESFDTDIRDDLRYMDKNQTGSFAFYYSAGQLAIHQVKINGAWTWMVFSNKTRSWSSPFLGISVKSLFERDGILYGTDMANDTIYKIFSTYSDNGAAIEHKAFTGDFDVDFSHVRHVELKGTITPQATLYYRTIVNNAEPSSVSPKTILGSSFTYPTGNSLGSSSVAFSSLSDGSSSEQLANWKKDFDVFPRSANTLKIGFSSFGEANRWTWKWYLAHLTKFSESSTPLS